MRQYESMSNAQQRRVQMTNKQKEFLKQCSETCAKHHGLCSVGDYAIVDLRIYDVKPK